MDNNKVSFDFDGVLQQIEFQEKAKRFIKEGKEVFVVTRRYDSEYESVFNVAEKIGIPISRIYFTNGKPKWKTLVKLGIGRHYDDNGKEVDSIEERTEVVAIKVL